MLKIGVLGAGHLGKIHIKCIKEIQSYELVGFYDPNTQNAKKTEKEFSVKKFDSIVELIDSVDVIDIVTPTVSHFECASEAMKRSKHVFIEKPLTYNLEQAQKLIDLSTEADVKVQVGHVERFNPAFIAACPYISNPLFIEIHRLAQFNPRGTDVSVVLDLMIHDIDIVLSIVKSNIRKINASGVKIVSDSPDIASARIEFDNGCVANLTASRFSLKNMRKTRIFQSNAYIAINFLTKKTEIIKLEEVTENTDPLAMLIDMGENKGQKQIIFENPKIESINAIQTELESFYHSIINNTIPVVSIMDGYKALNVANKIIEKLKI